MKVFKTDLQFTPEEAGYSPERLDLLDSFYSGLIEKGELQGAMYGMARNGKIFAVRSMGKRRYDDADGDTLKCDSIRRIASMTKLFVGVSIMKLAEDGVLKLGDEVYLHLSEFDHGDFKNITVANLLTHTSGLSADGGARDNIERYRFPWWDMLNIENSPYETWLQAAITGPLRSKPGEEWSYCTLGYMLLGEIITRVTGVNCEKWIIDNIVKPLGMTDTYFDVPEDKWNRIIAVDEWSDPYKSAERRKKESEENKKNNRKKFEIPRTGGGLYSTAGDILIFGNMLCNNGIYNGVRILSRKSVELFRSDCGFDPKDYCWNATGQIKHYGYGPELYGKNRFTLLNSRSTYGHEGAGYCGLFIDPEENFVIVYFIPNNTGWHAAAVNNGVNLIWSGIL